MSWFSKTKDQLKGATGRPTKTSSVKTVGAETSVVLSPRITEKAANSTGNNVYTFNVHQRATKQQIKQAIEIIYQVRPIKVRMVNLPAKSITRRGIPGRKARGRKAYVQLRSGDKIDFM